jgi:chromosome segregation ATPase
MDQYRSKRRHIQDLQDDIQQLEQTLNRLSENESAKSREIAILDQKIEEIEKDLQDQETKLNRANKQVLR